MILSKNDAAAPSPAPLESVTGCYVIVSLVFEICAVIVHYQTSVASALD